MRDSERKPFYDDIAHVIQKTKKRIAPVGFEPEILAVASYRIRPTALWFKAVYIRLF